MIINQKIQSTLVYQIKALDQINFQALINLSKVKVKQWENWNNKHACTSHTVILSDWTLKNWALPSFACQSFINKLIFQFLWGVFDGTAIPAHSNFFRQNGTFYSLHEIRFFGAKCLYMKCYESAILWFYPKFVSDSVQVLIEVDKSG